MRKLKSTAGKCYNHGKLISEEVIDMEKEHYSYRVYKNKEIAEQFESDRFGGPVGDFLKTNQEKVILDSLSPVENRFFLDVGGGTGRISRPIARNGGKVLLLDSSEEMLHVAGLKLKDTRLKLLKVRGDAHELPVKNGSVDGVIMLRVLMHVIDWKTALSEIGRVGHSTLILDFARSNSFATLESVFRKIQSGISKNVQAYNTIREKDIVSYLEKKGYEVEILDPGYFLPLKFYRILNSGKMIAFMENIFKKIGLSNLFGSPVTLIARRKMQV